MLWRSTANFLRTFFTSFGITGNPQVSVSDTVIPVSVVDNETVQIASTPVFGVPASAGETTAPVANTRLANTGPQPAGSYTVLIFATSGNEGNAFRIRRRNAADTADIWSLRIQDSSTNNNAPPWITLTMRITLALNESLVVENVNAGVGAIVYQASIFLSSG